MICPLALMLSREQIARGQIARHGVRIAFARYTDPLILLSTHSSPRLSLDPDPNVDAPAPHSPARDDADLVFRAASQEEQYHRPAGGRPVQVGPPVRRHRLAPGPGRPRRRCPTPTHPQIRPRLASRAACPPQVAHRRAAARFRALRSLAGVGRRIRLLLSLCAAAGGAAGRVSAFWVRLLGVGLRRCVPRRNRRCRGPAPARARALAASPSRCASPGVPCRPGLRAAGLDPHPWHSRQNRRLGRCRDMSG